jgi:hypothetical protein
MHVVGKLRVEYLVVLSVDIVTFQHIDNFEHKNSASFGVNPLAFNLVALVISQKLLLSYQVLPHLVEYAVRKKQVTNP